MLLTNRRTCVGEEYGLKPNCDADFYCCVFGLLFSIIKYVSDMV